MSLLIARDSKPIAIPSKIRYLRAVYLGIYKVPCTFRNVYIGEMRHAFVKQIAEHASYISLNQPEKSGLEEHYLVNKHQPVFDSTSVISPQKRASGIELFILEGITIHLEPLAGNRDTVYNLSMCWKLALQLGSNC